MGGSNSHHQQPLTGYMEPQLIHEPQPPQYPDMNMIFKSIPKMMQVADDMHRMSNYMMDLRNMMLGCSVLTFVGIMLFLLLKYLQGRKSGTRRRRRTHNNRIDDSEQSSLSIGRPSGYRHYHSARPVDSWAHKIEMDRMIDSTSTRHTHATHGQTPAHGQGLMLNNKTPLALGSPEHHNFGSEMQSPLHEPLPQQQSQSRVQTPISSTVTTLQQQNYHSQHSAPNGALKDSASAECIMQRRLLHVDLLRVVSHNVHAQFRDWPAESSALTLATQEERLDPVKLVVDEMPYMDNEQQ